MRHYLSMLAGYHAWAWGVLDAALSPLSAHDYGADRGLFFGSIHRTLNHLLLADRVWFGRVIGEPYAVAALDTEIETDRARLASALREQTPRWQELLARQDGAWGDRTINYTNFSGKPFSQPLAEVLLHVVNHGTHHRGQISAALSGLGHTTPEMDLIFYLRDAARA